ncbi:general transcription factor IIE subunit 1 [Tachysurus ichikawai]
MAQILICIQLSPSLAHSVSLIKLFSFLVPSIRMLKGPGGGTFRCTFCQTEVEEDESAVPKKDARTLVARFNEQIEPIYVLLRETEDVNLSHELLEPEPTEIPALKQSRERAAAAAGLVGAGAAGREVWRTKGSSYADLYTQNVVINMEEQESQQDRAAEAKAPKERPVWLTQSTVQGAYNENDALKAGIEYMKIKDSVLQIW